MTELFDHPFAVGIDLFIELKVPSPGKPGHANRGKGAGADRCTTHQFKGALFVRPESPSALIDAGVAATADGLGDAVGNVKRGVGVASAAIINGV